MRQFLYVSGVVCYIGQSALSDWLLFVQLPLSPRDSCGGYEFSWPYSLSRENVLSFIFDTSLWEKIAGEDSVMILGLI